MRDNTSEKGEIGGPDPSRKDTSPHASPAACERKRDPQATDENVYSAFDDAGEIYLFDDEGRDLKGWPVSWPATIPAVSVRTFMRARGISLFSSGEPPKRREEIEQQEVHRAR